MTPVTTNHQIGADCERAVRRLRAQPEDPSAFHDQIGGLRLHAQIERLVAPGLLGQKIEEVPLRHQCNEFAARRQVAEIHHLEVLGADLTGQRLNLLMREL